MKKILIALLIIIISSMFNIYASDMSDSDYGTGKRFLNRRSSLRDYRKKHYRDLPKWWYLYPYEKANFIWVSYRKNKALVSKVYNVVINHPRYRGAGHYNKALRFYRLGAKYVYRKNFRYAIGYSHLARRRLYMALFRAGSRYMLPRRYQNDIPSSREFKRIEYSYDKESNKRDIENRKERARRRLMGRGSRREKVNIELDDNVREIKRRER